MTLGRDVGRDRLVRIFCYAANLLTVIFGLLVVTVNHEPQVIFGFVLIVLMTCTAFGTVPRDVYYLLMRFSLP